MYSSLFPSMVPPCPVYILLVHPCSLLSSNVQWEGPSPWRPILGILFCSETVSLGSSRINSIGSLMSNLEFFSLCHMFVSDIPVLCTCYGASQIYPSRFCHPIPDFLACTIDLWEWVRITCTISINTFASKHCLTQNFPWHLSTAYIIPLTGFIRPATTLPSLHHEPYLILTST